MKLAYDASDELRRQFDVEVDAGAHRWGKVKPKRKLELIGLWARAYPDLWNQVYNSGGTTREAELFLSAFTAITERRQERYERAVYSERMGHVLRTVERIMQTYMIEALEQQEADQNAQKTLCSTHDETQRLIDAASALSNLDMDELDKPQEVLFKYGTPNRKQNDGRLTPNQITNHDMARMGLWANAADLISAASAGVAGLTSLLYLMNRRDDVTDIASGAGWLLRGPLDKQAGNIGRMTMPSFAEVWGKKDHKFFLGGRNEDYGTLVRGGKTQFWINPDPDEIKKAGKHINQFRVAKDTDGNLYMWDVEDGTHKQFHVGVQDALNKDIEWDQTFWKDHTEQGLTWEMMLDKAKRHNPRSGNIYAEKLTCELPIGVRNKYSKQVGCRFAR